MSTHVRAAIAGALAVAALALGVPAAQAAFGVTEAHFEAGTCSTAECTYSSPKADFYTEAAGHPERGITSVELNSKSGLLGVREPATYGYDTLADVEQRCLARAGALDLAIDFRQTNHEGQMVDWIHEAREAADGIILNAGALTHTSVAVLDALNAAELPIIEVHLSNIFAREPYRHHSYISAIARGVICGFGSQSYVLALDAIAYVLEAASRDE